MFISNSSPLGCHIAKLSSSGTPFVVAAHWISLATASVTAARHYLLRHETSGRINVCLTQPVSHAVPYISFQCAGVAAKGLHTKADTAAPCVMPPFAYNSSPIFLALASSPLRNRSHRRRA